MATYESPIETTLNSLVTWLNANVGTYLTGITTAMGDGITLEAFEKVELSDGDVFTQTTYPVLLATPEEVGVEQLSFGNDELKISASLVIAFSKGSPEVATKKILRYVEAVRELIRDNRTAIGNLISVTGVRYYPTAPGDVVLHVAVVSIEIIKDVANV